MTAHRFARSVEYPPVRAGLVFVALVGSALALTAAAACGDDETPTPTNYVGAADAEPPRLGPPPDGGAR